MSIIEVTLKIDIERMTPSTIITADGRKYPLWAISEDDLRAVGAAIVATMIRLRAEQRAEEMLDVGTDQFIGGHKK